MFNLEEKIGAWRQQMAAGGVKTPAVLDELESHLREDIERQVKAGVDTVIAFEVAESRVGKCDLLKAEFAKIAGAKEGRLGKMIGSACCVFAGLYSMVFAPHLFTIDELSPAQRIFGLTAVALTLLSIASWRFSYKYLPVIRDRHTRTIIAMACGFAGLAWLLVFATLLPNVIVPHFMENATPDGFRPVFKIGLSLLWAMTLAAILGGIAYGLEGAARRGTKENAYV
jgi:hypothetical protein